MYEEGINEEIYCNLQKVIKMSKAWASKHFIQMLVDYDKHDEFFNNHTFEIIVKKNEE